MLILLERSFWLPTPMKRSESLAGVNPSVDRSMILLHDVVQVRTGTAAAPPAEFALLLQFCHDLGIRRVAVDVDHPGPRMTRSKQGILEETLGGAASLRAAIRKSMVAPAESTARYREVHSPFTRSRVGGGARSDEHAGVGAPLKVHVQLAGMDGSRRVPAE